LNFTIFLYVDKEFIYIAKRNTEQKKQKQKQKQKKTKQATPTTSSCNYF
jgi:hypothetical protein